MSQIIYGDALESLRQISSDSVDVCVTSPPYKGKDLPELIDTLAKEGLL